MSEETPNEEIEDYETDDDPINSVEQKELTEVEGSSTMEIKQTDQIVIGGKKGSGKTNLMKTLIKWLITVGCPVIIIDPLWEYKEFEQQGATVVHIKYGNVVEFNNYINQLYTKWKGMLIIDEADGFLPNKTNLLIPSRTLVHLGRHYGIGSAYVTRRLSNLHTDVISQTGKLFLFRLYAGADAQYLERAQLGEIVDPVFNLEKYWFVSYDADTATIQINEPIPKYA